jgi:uncharacterized protein (TIGR03083 family)
MPLTLVDTRLFFRPLCTEIVERLRALPLDAWERRTLAPRWRVRDVVAHLSDTALRRLSMHRDRHVLAPSGSMTTERDLVAFINELNDEWVRLANRFSPRILTDLYAMAGAALAAFMEAANLDGDARLPVSWTGEARSPAWLDIGREFTEVWHHGSQINDAVEAGEFSDSRWLHAVLLVALHAVPRAYRDSDARRSGALVIEITGPGGGTWTVRHREQQWHIDDGADPHASARAILTGATAWRLFFNALPPAQAEARVRIEGDVDLARPLLRVRSVIV